MIDKTTAISIEDFCDPVSIDMKGLRGERTLSIGYLMLSCVPFLLVLFLVILFLALPASMKPSITSGWTVLCLLLCFLVPFWAHLLMKSNAKRLRGERMLSIGYLVLCCIPFLLVPLLPILGRPFFGNILPTVVGGWIVWWLLFCFLVPFWFPLLIFYRLSPSRKQPVMIRVPPECPEQMWTIDFRNIWLGRVDEGPSRSFLIDPNSNYTVVVYSSTDGKKYFRLDETEPFFAGNNLIVIYTLPKAFSISTAAHEIFSAKMVYEGLYRPMLQTFCPLLITSDEKDGLENSIARFADTLNKALLNSFHATLNEWIGIREGEHIADYFKEVVRQMRLFQMEMPSISLTRAQELYEERFGEANKRWEVLLKIRSDIRTGATDTDFLKTFYAKVKEMTKGKFADASCITFPSGTIDSTQAEFTEDFRNANEIINDKYFAIQEKIQQNIQEQMIADREFRKKLIERILANPVIQAKLVAGLLSKSSIASLIDSILGPSYRLDSQTETKVVSTVLEMVQDDSPATRPAASSPALPTIDNPDPK